LETLHFLLLILNLFYIIITLKRYRKSLSIKFILILLQLIGNIMSTEELDPRFHNLDTWNTIDAVSLIAEGQFGAISAAHNARREIAMVVDAAYARLKDGKGRLVYIGAGTSGRVAVQDGVELHPTYGWPNERLLYAMAGGERAILHAVENAEDDFEGGRKFAVDNNIDENDVLIGVAASGRTPFTLGLLQEGKARGALTIGMANNFGTPILLEPDFSIFLDTGAEPVAGSTRMKAGTAQKVALNIFSTTLMVKLGGVYRGLMVGMIATNQKLRNRAARIVSDLSGADFEASKEFVAKSGGNIKRAVLLAYGVSDDETAQTLLENAQGNLRDALKIFLGD
jgi:N-acetylmuramic acid 6-phosphate etherase